MAFKTTIGGNSEAAEAAASSRSRLSDELKHWLKSEIDLAWLAESLFCTRWSEASGATLPNGEIRVTDLWAKSKFADGDEWVRFLCPWRDGADSTGFAVSANGWYDHVKKESGDAFSFVRRLIAYRWQIELRFPQAVALTINLAGVADWDCENESEETMKQAALEFAANQRMPDETERNERSQTKCLKENQYDYQHQRENGQ